MAFPGRIDVPATQVVDFLSDDFNGALDAEKWEVVAGSPTSAAGELYIASGTTILSKQSFQPPCLVEVVETMTARASTDNFRFGFYTDDNNLVEWGATGTTTSYMDARMRAGGVASDQASISVGAANNSYKLASIYVGLGEVVWMYRSINSLNIRNEVYRYVEQGIPDGPFRIRLAGLAGTSTLKVHRVTAYQLADIVPPGAMGHHIDSMAVPVRLTNTPFVASPSNSLLPVVSVAPADTFSSLAAGSVGTGSSRYGYMEQVHVQAYYSGDQPFSAWLEAKLDGTNWQVIWYGTATDATADAVARYYAVSPILQVLGSRNFRVKVKNNGASAGNFRGVICFTSL